MVCIAYSFFTEELREEFKKWNREDISTLLVNIDKIVQKSFFYKNLKIEHILTTANFPADNPERPVPVNGESLVIIGPSGSGKTTFFEKLLHPLIWPNAIYPANQDYVTGLFLDLVEPQKNEKYHFMFTTTTPNLIKFALNNEDGPAAELKMQGLGLKDCYLTALYFISAAKDYLNFFADFDGDISRYKKFLFHPLDLEILTEMKNCYNNIQDGFDKYAVYLRSLIDDLKALEGHCRDLQNESSQIREFLQNQEKISLLLEILRKNDEQKAITKQLNKIDQNITELKKKDTLKQCIEDDRKLKVVSKSIDPAYHYFLRVKFEDAIKICPKCKKPILFRDFINSVKNERCYICNHDFTGYEPFNKYKTGISSESVKGPIDNAGDILSLERQKEELLQSRQGSGSKLTEDQLKLLPIVRPFFIELVYGKTSFEDYTNFLEGRKALIDEEILNMNEKVNEYNEEIEEIQELHSSMKKMLQSFQGIIRVFEDKLNTDCAEIYGEFCVKITDFWDKLATVVDKQIRSKNDHLYIVTVTRASLFPNRTRINNLYSKQKRMSQNQVEILRYSIQLALVYCIFKKYQTIPLKLIAFDDPNQKNLDALINLLDKDFVKKFGFQIIILTHVGEEYTWKTHKFALYDGNFPKTSQEFQGSILKWVKEPSSDTSNESEKEGPGNNE